MFKKFFAFTSALILTAGSVSCSEKEKESTQTTEQTYTAEKLSDKAYKKEKLPQIEGLDMLYAIRNSSCGNLLLGSSGSESPVFLMTDSQFQNAEKITVDNFSIGINYEITLCPDGSFITFVNEQDEDTDEYSYWVRKYSSSGELVSDVELTELYETVEPSKVLIDGMYCGDGNNFVIVLNGTNYCLSTDGKFLGELTLSDENQSIGEFGTDSNGQLWCTVKVDIENVKLCRVDAENCKIDESGAIYNVGGSIIAPIMAGTGDYTMFLTGRTQIFGIKADGTIDALFSLLATDINVNLLSVYSFDENCRLLMPKIDFTAPVITRYTEVDPAELENIPVITFGCYDKSWLGEYAEFVSEEQSDYRIEFVEYGYDTDAIELQKDFISGNVPDLLLYDDFLGLKLEEKGVLCDLYEFMDKDAEMGRDAFNSNLLHLLEQDNSVYTLYRSVYIEAMYGKPEFVGDNLYWSADDYIQACENRPADMYVYQIDNDYLEALRYETFIDMDNKKCHFDSEEFLKICKYAESKSDYMERTSEYDYEFADWEHPTQEELDMREVIDREVWQLYMNNKAMLDWGFGFGSVSGMFMQKIQDFSNPDDAVMVGYITPDGGQPIIDFSNGISISTQCKNKEFAWDAVKKFVLYQDERSKGFDALSMVNSLLDNAVKNALNPPEGYNGNGGKYTNYMTDEIIDTEFTQADADEIMNILNTAKYTTVFRLPDSVRNIYYEELEKFQNHEYTAEQFADILQNRLSIAVAE